MSAGSWVSATPTALQNAPAPADGKPAEAALEKVWPTTYQQDEQPKVTFAIRPERITVGHSFKTEGITGLSVDDQIKNLGYIEIGISKMVLAGPGIKKYCDTLLIWSYPADSSGSPLIGARGKEAALSNTLPVKLKFTWGAELNFPVCLRKVDITYVRFAPSGEPIRAEISLSLYQNRVKNLPGTNPTSGGPAGRRTRVLDSSDRLPALAAANYGRPAAWRQIAQANGVDDPLRMKPGTAVFLPEPDEMASGADGAVLRGAGR
jgi:nucleoid-associated protein YgaU